MSSDNAPQESNGLEVALPALLMIGTVVVLLMLLLGASDSGNSQTDAEGDVPVVTATPVVLAESSTPRPPTNTPTPIVLPSTSNTEDETEEPTDIVEATTTPTPLVLPDASATAEETEEAMETVEVTPSAEPTAEETEEAVEPTEAADSGSEGDVELAAVEGDPENGEVIFNTFQTMASFSCSNCHLVDSESMLIGPGLFGIGQRAESRVSDISAVEYIHQSIVEPNAYIVDGYTANLMPQNYADIFSEEELNDLIAYIMTLGN